MPAWIKPSQPRYSIPHSFCAFFFIFIYSCSWVEKDIVRDKQRSADLNLQKFASTRQVFKTLIIRHLHIHHFSSTCVMCICVYMPTGFALDYRLKLHLEKEMEVFLKCVRLWLLRKVCCWIQETGLEFSLHNLSEKQHMRSLWKINCTEHILH